MSKRKTKYNKPSESQFNWIKSCSKDVHSVHCKLCQKDFSISGGGVTQIKSHATSKLHLAREKEREGQSHFSKDAHNSIQINNPKISLSTEEEIRNAEIIQALKCVESNYSFASTSNDGERFRAMFPDAQTAKHFKQGETKTKYTIQYGIYPYFKDLLLEDLKNTAFTFKFDESTTQQVKKQYDGYVQYWSKHHNCIKMVYCGTIMVDHCPAEKLLEHFLEFTEKINLDLKLILHIGMDGPSVNLKFEDLLKSSPHIKSLGTTILSIGTCPLHIVHNTF